MKDRPLTRSEIEALNWHVRDGNLEQDIAEHFMENPIAARAWLDKENETDLADERE